MSVLFDAYNAKETKAYTDNGAITNSTTGNDNLDLFGVIGASRGKNILPIFKAAMLEDPDIATRILMYARDIRGGLGERSTFLTLAKYLADSGNKEAVMGIINKIPELGRFKDLKVFFDTEYEEDAINVWLAAISVGNGLALKWAPVKNKQGAWRFYKRVGCNQADWRKFIAKQRKTVEQDICAKTFENIDYSKVPSVASIKYVKTFNKFDSERYTKFRIKLAKGETKINAGAVYPYDILDKMLIKNRWGKPSLAEDYDVFESMWKALPNLLEGNEEKILPIVDTSGSMYSRVNIESEVKVIDVALSLGLYISERTEGKFKDSFMTFDTNPKFLKVSGTIGERAMQMAQAPWGGSTNIQAVFETLLKAAVKADLPEDEMPTKLLLVSDMQFNRCISGVSVSALDMIKAEYKKAGYNLPQLVFWQVNASGSRSPITQHESGVALVSGFSPNILKSILGKTLSPMEVMFEAVMHDKYKVL